MFYGIPGNSCLLTLPEKKLYLAELNRFNMACAVPNSIF
jgi:hypothetical protein